MVQHRSPCKSPSLRYALRNQAGFVFVRKSEGCLALQWEPMLPCKGVVSVPSHTPCCLGTPWDRELPLPRQTLPSVAFTWSFSFTARAGQTAPRWSGPNTGRRHRPTGSRGTPSRHEGHGCPRSAPFFSFAAASCFSFHLTCCKPEREREPTRLLHLGGMGKSLNFILEILIKK